MSAADVNKLPPQLPRPPRTWLTLLMGGVLLLAGGVIGAGGTVLVVKQRIEQAQDEAIDAPSEMSRRITERMVHELQITPEQAEQVRTAFDEHHQGMRTLFGTLHEDIQAILTPEQFSRWQEISRRFKKRDHRDGGGPRNRDGRGDGEYRERPRDPNRDFDGDHYRRDEPMRDGPRPPREEGFRDGRPPLPPPPEGQFPPPDGQGAPPRHDGQGTPPPPPPQHDPNPAR